jgi:hypothetical protein
VGRDKPALGGAGRRVAGARDGGGAVREGDGVARDTMETGGRRGGARHDGHGDGVGVGLHGGAIDWRLCGGWVGRFRVSMLGFTLVGSYWAEYRHCSVLPVNRE